MTTQRQPTQNTYRTALEDIEISADVETAIAQMQASGKDTGSLTAQQRAGYVVALCRALRLNPLTNPVQFIRLNGKEVLYVTRTATDQLAAIHGLNRKTVRGPEIVDIAGTKVALCTVEVSLPNGRSETATATLPVADPAMLYMKLETKAKRRGTLAILGLGLLAEDEAESIPGAERADFRAPAPPDPRDIAPLGVEAPAAPVAVAPPGLSADELAAMLAMLAHCETIDALDATRAEIRPDVSTRATPAQRAQLRAAAEARRAALTPTEPTPPPRSGRKSARNDIATANDTTAEAAPAGEAASASRERIASAGGVRAYLASKGSRREVEAAVRAHGRHVAGLAQIAAERLDALTPTDADGARPTRDTLLALALRWSAEGPLAEMRRAA